MGFLDKLLGREPRMQGQDAPGSGGGSWSTQGSTGQPRQSQPLRGSSAAGSASAGAGAAGDEDARAIARYRYLLRTAPPETLEQVHAEAFSRLTPDQRQQVLEGLRQDAPQGEAPTSAEPQDLARAATRAEMRQPGTLERTFGRGGFGGGMGGSLMGSMMGTIAGVVVGSAIADSLFGDYGSSPEAAEAGESGAPDESDDAGDPGAGGGTGDAGGDMAASGEGSDPAGSEFGGSDLGGGGDLGSGDFGGGDFGGGDFGGGDF